MGIDFENIIKLPESAKWLFFGILMIVIVCSAIIANEMDRIAAIKGHPEKRWFWYCFFFGVAGWIMVAMLPDRGGSKKQ